MIQEFSKKLKHPQIRMWIHGNGDDTYVVVPFSKKNLVVSLVQKPFERGGEYYEKPLIAYDGYEFTPKEFLKKYPKYKLKTGKIGKLPVEHIYKSLLK